MRGLDNFLCKLFGNLEIFKIEYKENAVLSYQIILDRDYPNKSNKQDAWYYVHTLKLIGANSFLSILRCGDQVSFSSLSELEEDYSCHIFIPHNFLIPQDGDWLSVLTEREFPAVPVAKLKK
jgi:hypothetical protein